MRISDWSSDVCSSDLMVHKMLRQIGALAAQPGGNATCTIAALLRAGSVGVPYSVAGHGACAVRGLDGDELIEAADTMDISHRPHRCHIAEAPVTAIEPRSEERRAGKEGIGTGTYRGE